MMKKINNKGFTLIELIATLVILSLVIGLASYSITTLISNSREKNYNLLIEEITTAVELYYQECKYVNDNCVSDISLGYLVTNGYLKGNATNSDDSFDLVNPKDNESISDCNIKYSYNNGKIEVEADGQNSTNSCPTSY